MGMIMRHTNIEKAKFHLQSKMASGSPLETAKKNGKISSFGTLRVYTSHFAQFLDYLYENEIAKPKNVTSEILNRYIEMRSNDVKQKTLDADRQALQVAFSIQLKYQKSEVSTILKSRAYSSDQVDHIKSHQQPANRFSTELTYYSGLRAHELLTLSRQSEQQKSPRRAWPEKIFLGMENVVIYTVKGKGGLIREIALSRELADRLEERRLKISRIVIDREIRYHQHYDLSHGQKWSQSFSRASNQSLGFSAGGHGLRHAYAQDRMRVLLRLTLDYQESLSIVSCELGHFRPEITQIYLR